MNKEIKKISLDTSLSDEDRKALMAYAEFLKNRKLEKILNCVFIILIILLTFSISFLIYIKLNSNTYSLNGESTNFTYNNLTFFEKPNEYLILYGNLKIKNEDITYDNILSFSLESGDKLIVRSSKILQGYHSESKGYDEMFPKDVVNEIQTKWNIKITYELNGETKEEIIELTATKE